MDGQGRAEAAALTGCLVKTEAADFLPVNLVCGGRQAVSPSPLLLAAVEHVAGMLPLRSALLAPNCSAEGINLLGLAEAPSATPLINRIRTPATIDG